jgi:hypothetical protein
MNFPYLKLPGISRRPLVPVLIKHGKEFLPQPILCLVDSGADVSYFDISLAHELKINFKGLKPVPSWGINGEKFEGYQEKIIVTIGGWEFPVVAIFSENVTRAFCVLGQEGLFAQSRVIFERYKWNLEIKPRVDIN